MTKQERLEVISESYINGQYKQMVEQIDEYSPADFFQDFLKYLDIVSATSSDGSMMAAFVLKHFSAIVIAYFKIKENKCQ